MVLPVCVFILYLAATLFFVSETSVSAVSHYSIPSAKLASLNDSNRLQYLTEGYVFCGDDERVCPSSAPICCGSGDDTYCIPAGSSCCGLGRNATSCAAGQQCCSSSYFDSICCEAGTSCYINQFGTPSCERDECSPHRTIDECLKGATSQCGWCCEEHRCVSRSHGRCPTTPITAKQRCGSRCEHANTCELCLHFNSPHYSQGDSFHTIGSSAKPQSSQTQLAVVEMDEQCVWCCATMSCISAKKSKFCSNKQFLMNSSRCEVCMYNGSGVAEPMDETLALYTLLGSIILIVGIVCFMSCIRIVVEFVLESRSDEPLTNGQSRIQRFGFKIDDTIPSIPLLRRFRRLFIDSGSAGNLLVGLRKNREIASDVVVCHYCNQRIRLATLKSHVMPVRPQLASANHHLTSQAQQKLAEAAPEDSTTDPLCSHKITFSDDLAVILLPCKHCICYACLGISIESLDKHLDSAPRENPPNDEIPSSTALILFSPETEEDTSAGGLSSREAPTETRKLKPDPQVDVDKSDQNNPSRRELVHPSVGLPQEAMLPNKEPKPTVEDAIAKRLKKNKCIVCGKHLSEYLITSKIRLI